jgi:hypothetical protein
VRDIWDYMIIYLMEVKEIKASPYRYINLILFVLAGFCNSVGTQAFSAIGPITRDLYGVS